MLISFVIPTRNRSRELAYTLDKLRELDLDMLGGISEVVIVDNDSDERINAPDELGNGITITRVQLDENRGAGARNIGVEHACGQWILMLDDDSNLMPGEVGAFLSNLEPTIGAVGGEIFLPGGHHEAGGLPEVIVGCGCAIRRDAFLEVGGYDAGFGYYAEEYDLCAKLISAGYRIGHTRAFGFEHRKCSTGRDMDEILFRLVRNNGWVIQRYAPDWLLGGALDEMLRRYRHIAMHEQALAGYQRGVDELERTIEDQTRSALCGHGWDRFVGKDAMQRVLAGELDARRPSSVSIVGPPHGKGFGQICDVIESHGLTLSDQSSAQGAIEVIGTLSPGPMLDAHQQYPNAICPWSIEDSCMSRVVAS